MPPAGMQAGAGGGGSSTVLKIVLIVIGVIVFFVILIVAAVGYVGYRAVHAVKEASHGGTVTIPGSSGGSFSINSNKTYSAAELGIDIYPSATSARGSMKMSLPTGSMVTGVFATSDSKDQVIAFYKPKFSGDNASVTETDDGAVMTLKKSDKDQVMLTVTSRNNENDGKTKVVIVHTVSKQ